MTEPTQTASAGSEPKKILIVDDEPGVRRLCKSVLQQHGFDAVLAEDGQQGLDIYKELQGEIVLILSDVTMPRKDGLQMTDEILEINPDLNVILMTGYTTAALIPERATKICALLRKPFAAADLITAVQKCLEEKRRRRVRDQN